MATVEDDQDFEQMTMVLSRSYAQQAAFEQFLADQQTPGSPNYHKWITAAEVGERFGLSDSDLAAISGWLTSQGLHVNVITPDRTSIQFGGTALNIGRAFQTSLSYYKIRGQKRLSVDSEPSIPEALSSVVVAVRGLYDVGDHPMHIASMAPMPTPDYTSSSSGSHFLTPGDFATIYDVPSSYTGAGMSIGIVGWNRVYTGDLSAYRSLTATTFANPTEIIPTAYGGTDPGTAYSTSQSSSVDTGGQAEATLDVIRAGATAPGATLKLVVSQATTASNDGIGADTQYLVYTTPTPVQVISISFGACEAGASSGNVAFWNNLFSTGAAEGISTFVSSGDSAAAGCDDAFTMPVGSYNNSPNYICSSSYATCVGGTQFNDTTNPSTYWSSSNGTGLKSVLSYIPEGAWNESSTSYIAGTGGGVSNYVATPSWQNVTGVPAARVGRYTPDVSFSSSNHDGYLACFAAAGSDCSSRISIFSGTSAAAPGMAGIAALLAQKMGAGQGNLNPSLYSLFTSAPAAFHDTTISSSGVASCTNTPSICNSSIYYNSGTSTSPVYTVQAGFLLTTGFDQATGLGSLDVANFLSSSSTSLLTPTVTVTPASNSITTAQSLNVTVTVSGTSGTPTGTVTVSSGSYASSPTTISAGSVTINIPAGSLASGSTTITATYIPDNSSATTYRSSVGTASSAVTISKVTPTVNVTSTSSSITTADALSVTVTVNAGAGTATATGSVTLSGGGYTSSAATLSSGSATLLIPAGSLAVGSDSITATYTPDTAAATIYNAATSSGLPVSVTKATPTVVVTPYLTPIVPGQTATIYARVNAGSGPTPTGTVILTIGSYTSAATTLSSGLATINIPANTFSQGSLTPTASYTPDSTSAPLYNSATGTGTLTVAKVTPTLYALASPSNITTTQTTTVTVNLGGNAGNPTPTGSVVLTSGSYTSASTLLSAGAASIVIPGGALATGNNTITATYTPDNTNTGSISFNSNTATTQVVVGTVAPFVAVVATPSTFTTIQGTSVTVTLSGGTGNPTVTGSVILTSGSYTSAATTLTAGAATIAIPAGALATGTPTITATYTPDTAGTANYKTSSGSTQVTVNTPTPTFTLSGTAVTVSRGSASPSTITVTPLYGFIGAVTLSATVTSKPTGSQYAPALSFSPAAATITGASAVTSSMTVTAANVTAAVAPADKLPLGGWRTSGFAALAALVLFVAPFRIRKWRAMVGTLALLLAVVSGIAACGGTAATPSKANANITVTPASTSITNLQTLNVTITVSGSPTPTGTVTLYSGSTSVGTATLSNGTATISLAVGALTVGTDQLTAAYTPDSTSSSTYNSSTSTATSASTVTVSGASTAGSYVVTITGTSGSTTATTTVNVTVQ